jgi:tetratricopeptide (TPR) repeat protein
VKLYLKVAEMAYKTGEIRRRVTFMSQTRIPLLGFLLVSALIMSSIDSAAAAKNFTLPSGAVIVVEGVGKIFFTGQKAWALVLNYQTNINLSDTTNLRAQAIEIWKHFFGRMADETNLKDAVILAFDEPKPRFFGTRKQYGFVFRKEESGVWKITKPDQPVGSTQTDGLKYTRAGIAAQNKGNHNKAIALYTNAIESGDLSRKDQAAVLNNRCWAYNMVGSEVGLAIDDCTAALRLRPEFVIAYLNLGNAYFRSGDQQRSIKEFSTAIRLKPDLAVAYINRSSAYSGIGEYDQAIADLNVAIRLEPDLAASHNNRCDAYRNQGEYERAMSDCDTAIRLSPDFAIAYFTRGEVYEAKGDGRRAAREYKKAYELLPDHPAIKSKMKERGLLH